MKDISLRAYAVAKSSMEVAVQKAIEEEAKKFHEVTGLAVVGISVGSIIHTDYSGGIGRSAETTAVFTVDAETTAP